MPQGLSPEFHPLGQQRTGLAKPSQNTSPTIDMSPLIRASQHDDTVTAHNASESEIPEGRKSFAFQLPVARVADSDNEGDAPHSHNSTGTAMSVGSGSMFSARGEIAGTTTPETLRGRTARLSGSTPDPRNVKPLFPVDALSSDIADAIDFEQINREFEQRVGMAREHRHLSGGGGNGGGTAPASVRSIASSAEIVASARGGEYSGPSMAPHKAPGFSLLASATRPGAAVAGSRRVSGGGGMKTGGPGAATYTSIGGGERGREDGPVAATDESFHYSEPSLESAPLPGASSFQPLPGSSLLQSVPSPGAADKVVGAFGARHRSNSAGSGRSAGDVRKDASPNNVDSKLLHQKGAAAWSPPWRRGGAMSALSALPAPVSAAVGMSPSVSPTWSPATYAAMTRPNAAGTTFSSHAERAEASLLQQRAACLQNAVDELVSRTNNAETERRAGGTRWNEAAAMPHAAAEMLRTCEDPEQRQALRQRIQAWSVYCRDEAWIRWYATKKDWVQQDIGVAQRHTAALRQELFRLRDNGRRLEKALGSLRAVVSQRHHGADLRRAQQALRDMSEEHLRSKQQDAANLERKVVELRAADDEERRQMEILEAAVVEARAAGQQSRASAQEARRDFLKEQKKRVDSERMRLAQTCTISHSTASSVWVRLRAGMQLRIEQVAFSEEANIVRVGFRPSEPLAGGVGVNSPTEDAPRGLRRDLLVQIWKEAVEGHSPVMGSEDIGNGAVAEVEVRYAMLPALFGRLDVAALRTADQLRALENARVNHPEVTQLDASLCGIGGGRDVGPPRLEISMAILVVFSHGVDGCGRLVPIVLASRTDSPADVSVETVRCTVDFVADPLTFPQVCWVHMRVRDVTGAAQPKDFKEAEAEALSSVAGHFDDALGQVVTLLRQAASLAGPLVSPTSHSANRATKQRG
eukprot:TRINITY_DN23921_c0_g2_i1.p1 TRINITY_DN23921_c0_g2~~TRINITY_DN23921_c0_g2_i1.p1  ORF type:complete len:963 (-),score=174.33 TRINITY_DN23921_c0_g2_i1:214-2985(-)